MSTTMRLVEVQKATELYYNKQTVRNHVMQDMESDSDLMECIGSAALDIDLWARMYQGYVSKETRLEDFYESNHIPDLIPDMMSVVYQLNERQDLFTSIVGQCAGMIKGMSSHKDAVTTAAEVLTKMCDADLFDLVKRNDIITDPESGEEYKTQRYYVVNPWELSEELVTHMERTMYLPPMVVEPNLLTHNKSTGYLTKEGDSLILGKGNHHNGDISLDSLNKFNQIPLSLNVHMLKNIGELLDDETRQELISNPKRKLQHEKMLKESYHVYAYLIKHGNKFWLEHKPCKRGRTYAQGYHCSTQGNPFRKAIVELHNKEIVDGEF